MSYTAEELDKKLKYYKNLPEKARRHFLAVEYERLGRGSQRYMMKVFSCSHHTIVKGIRELSSEEVEQIDYTRQRKAGGGRKKKRSKSKE